MRRRHLDSFERTAIILRPRRPRRRLATSIPQITNTSRVRAAHLAGWSAPLTSSPNSEAVPTLIPTSAPPTLGLVNTMSCAAQARPKVIMPRLTPRVRSAGIASTTPTSIAPSVPHSSAGKNAKPACAASSAPITPPMPAMAYCASEICPAYPVSTTIDSSSVAVLKVTASAASVLPPNTVNMRTSVRAVVGNTILQRMRPVPIAGSRSDISPRSGSEEPRTTITTMITMSGSTSDIAVILRCCSKKPL